MADTNLFGALAGFGGGDVGFWVILAVIVGLGFLLVAALVGAFMFAVKKNWIILKWPIKVILLKPSGNAMQVFLDAAAIVSPDEGQVKWKLRSNGALFDPPGRDYLLPGDVIFAWSSNFRDIIPLHSNIVGYHGQADPARMKAIELGANTFNFTPEQEAEIMDEMKKDHPDIIKRIFDSVPEETPAPQAAEYVRRVILNERLIQARKEKVREDMDQYARELQRMDLTLTAKVDTGLINSQINEGQRILEQHQKKIDWLQVGLVVILLLMVVVESMILAGQSMSFSDAMKKEGDGKTALAGALDRNTAVLNQTEAAKLVQVMKPGGG